MTDAEKISMLREELRELAARYHRANGHGGEFDKCPYARCKRVQIVLHSTGEEE